MRTPSKHPPSTHDGTAATRSKPRPLPKLPLTAVMAAIPEDPDGFDALPVVSRPDGYYWQAPDGHQEVGPFETYELACADRDRGDEERAVPGEDLREAESEIGIADWIDAELGEPTEGLPLHHLRER
ncbi:MAG: hypothetical protein RL227_2879 [Pseudomonadota bacterium]|jgi:hypothetical protein